MNFRIRRATHEDALGIIDTHVRSIREICAKDYSSEQIRAWSGRKSRPHLWCQTIDRDYVWVVEDNDNQIFGFGHLARMDEEVGEMMGLYLAPELKGLGAGKQLIQTIFTEAQLLALKELQLLSTLTAFNFYKNFGFEKMEGQTSIEIQGVDIPCIPMRKVLF